MLEKSVLYRITYKYVSLEENLQPGSVLSGARKAARLLHRLRIICAVGFLVFRIYRQKPLRKDPRDGSSKVRKYCEHAKGTSLFFFFA